MLEARADYYSLLAIVDRAVAEDASTREQSAAGQSEAPR
jgi:hypothetical protein